MASKYPSVTASKQGAAAQSKPANFPKGKPVPANDNKIGLVKVAKAAALRSPNPYLRAFGYGMKIGDFLWELTHKPDPLIVSQKAPVNFPSQYWDGPFQCLNPGRPFVGYRLNATCVANTTGASNIGTTLPSTVPQTTTAISVLGKHPTSTNPPAYQSNEYYTPLLPKPSPIPVVVPGVNSVVGPAVLPQVWPLEAPLAVPTKAPASRPYERPEPGEEPSKPENKPDPLTGSLQPYPFYLIIVNDLPLGRVTVPRVKPRNRRGGRPPVRPPVVLPPLPVPFTIIPEPQPDRPPIVNPGTAVEFDPITGNVNLERYHDWGRDRPPNRSKTKRVRQEKPTTKSKIVGLVWNGINSLTEWFDFVGAMHDALPKEYQLSKKASKAQKLEYMHTHWDVWAHVDVAEGLQNYINNQMEDFVAALGGQQVKKVSQDFHIQTGLDRAVNQGRNYLSEYEEGGGEVSDWSFIPQLDIDATNGVISLSGPIGSLTWALGPNTLTYKRD